MEKWLTLLFCLRESVIVHNIQAIEMLTSIDCSTTITPYFIGKEESTLATL